MTLGTMSTVCACVLALVSVSGINAVPVYPEMDLSMLPPSVACLFACNICFDEEPFKMMTCANEMCNPEVDRVPIFKILKLGRVCKHFDNLESMFTGVNTVDQKASGADQTTDGANQTSI